MMPPAERGFLVLQWPGADASSDAIRKCQNAIDEALARGDRVCVIWPFGADDSPMQPGVEYFESRVHADLAVLASERSTRGNANRLADVLASLSGNVIGVVADPNESDEESERN